MSRSSGRPRVGRPPGPHDETLGRLLPVALRLFLDEGGHALTPTRLHHESGVARATIYRNWPEPEDLIEVMLARATETPPEDCITGDLAVDLQAAVDVLLGRFAKRPARAFFAACIEYGRRSSRMADVAEAFATGILAQIRMVIAGAVDDGRLGGDVDHLVAEIAGPLMLEHVILGRDVPTARGQALVRQFVDHHGCGPG
ncbi:MAG: TetR/AcrR family transcriptional regulator [Actinomycetota bacterium]